MAIQSTALIGVGGIGTALLPGLARLQPERLTLWDDDVVSEDNLINQLFWHPEDVGTPKVDAAAAWLSRSGLTIETHASRYTGEVFTDTIVIAGVDSMESRRLIWRGTKRADSRTKLLLDGRLSRETPFFLQLFAIPLDDPFASEAYEQWLEGDGELDTGRRDLDMVPAPQVLSGLISTLVVRWSRGDNLPWQVMWDGVSMSLASFESERS